MKIIVAGFSKTGTKSINAALTQLGYKVYDFTDHFLTDGKDWLKIFDKGGSVEDFRQMYENVDAVVDFPAFAFWKEIYDAFPQAKVILTLKDEDSWADACHEQMVSLRARNPITWLASIICPTYLKLIRFTQLYMPLCYAAVFPSFRVGIKVKKMLMKKRYREHNAYVVHSIPEEKLLLYNVTEGWQPLCFFLGVEIPRTPFPWKNEDDSEFETLMSSQTFAKQVRYELLAISACFFAVLGILLYVWFYIE